MKLRLIFRKGIQDYEGKLVGYHHITEIIEIDKFIMDTSELPELVAGEWVPEAFGTDD